MHQATATDRRVHDVMSACAESLTVPRRKTCEEAANTVRTVDDSDYVKERKSETKPKKSKSIEQKLMHAKN